MKHKKKLLMICEGKSERELLQAVLKYYPIEAGYEIYEYKTNLHIFAQFLFTRYLNDSIDDLNMIQVLKDYRDDAVLNEKYTDILFIFDFDPQDPRYNIITLRKLFDMFSDSTNQGQLFINYPMVESALDFNSLPESDYNHKTYAKRLLKQNGYKNKVKLNSVIKEFKNIDDTNLYIILKHTYLKMVYLCQGSSNDYKYLLEVENTLLCECDQISILCTCLLFLRDYNEEKFMRILANVAF